jgi:hypothetical protein
VTAARKNDAFVKVPLWWAVAASEATRDPAALVWIYLLHASWKEKSMTVPLPNGWLEQHGVGRKTKSRVLRDLEVAGLITVERSSRKSPRVTLVLL